MITSFLKCIQFILGYLGFLRNAEELSNRCALADTYSSACGNGWMNSAGPAEYAYACPQMAMLSSEMIDAAARDFPHQPFVFATAGGEKDDECGKCYQVRLLDAERENLEEEPLFLLVQIINSGWDVLPHQLDVFMGGGGFGYFTACNADCGSRACNGGTCRPGGAMFSGSFEDWIDAEFDDPNPCYSGGVKWLGADLPTLYDKCGRLVGNTSESVAARAILESCVATNSRKLHQNFVSTRSTRVRCPPSLVTLTWMQREDDTLYPVADPSLPLPLECNGDRNQGRYCMTTMQDCCKPSCAWSNKASCTAGHECVASCNRHGDIY